MKKHKHEYKKDLETIQTSKRLIKDSNIAICIKIPLTYNSTTGQYIYLDYWIEDNKNALELFDKEEIAITNLLRAEKIKKLNMKPLDEVKLGKLVYLKGSDGKLYPLTIVSDIAYRDEEKELPETEAYYYQKKGELYVKKSN